MRPSSSSKFGGREPHEFLNSNYLFSFADYVVWLHVIYIYIYMYRYNTGGYTTIITLNLYGDVCLILVQTELL